MRRRVVLATVMLALAGCGPANERPLRGAVPGSGTPTPLGIPPTLTGRATPPSPVAVVQVAQPSPSPGLAPSPLASPSAVAAPPIVRTIVPSANGRLPASGPVTVSAVLVGRTSDLATASLSLNGADTGAQIDKRSPRDWTIHTSQTLTPGTHTVRVLVRDRGGLAGGYTWSFTVGSGSEDRGSGESSATSPPETSDHPGNP